MSKPQIDDGGFAFPIPETDRNFLETGMTLRDWFAGQALAGICGDGIPGSHHHADQTARDAYAYADAMLAQRRKDGAA